MDNLAITEKLVTSLIDYGYLQRSSIYVRLRLKSTDVTI